MRSNTGTIRAIRIIALLGVMLAALVVLVETGGIAPAVAAQTAPPCSVGSGQDFSEQDLTGANLDAQDLSCANFSNSSLIDATLRSAILQYADFTGANMDRTVFERSDMVGAVLTDGFLRDANLKNTVLQSANLTRAHLERASLRGADITDAIVTDTRWSTTECPDGSFAWHESEAQPDQATSCPLPQPVGPIRPLPEVYPSATLARRPSSEARSTGPRATLPFGLTRCGTSAIA